MWTNCLVELEPENKTCVNETSCAMLLSLWVCLTRQKVYRFVDSLCFQMCSSDSLFVWPFWYQVIFICKGCIPLFRKFATHSHLLCSYSRIHIFDIYDIIEGSLEAKLPTIWKDGKGAARKKLGHGEGPKGEDKRWRREDPEKVRREQRQVREKVGKSRNTVFFRSFVAPEGRKVGSLKRRVRR